MELTTQQVMGVMLWWAEGSKSRKDLRWKNAWTYPVEVTNTDPRLIRLFLNFLYANFELPPQKIKLQLQIHQGDNQEELEHFWSVQTGVPKECFHKTIVRPIGNKIGKSRGTCKIRFNDKKIYQQLETQLALILQSV